MEKLESKLNIFFFNDIENLFWISFFRISVGIFILLHFVSILPDFNGLYSKDGIIPTDILDVFIPELIITFPKIITFFQSLGIEMSVTIMVFQTLYVSLCAVLISGVKPRLSAFFLLILQISLVKSNSYYSYGVDYFTSMSLFYLVLIPSNFEYTFRPIKDSNITVYKRLFQIHVSIAYFFSGFDKILGYNWHNGESIWKAINLPFANNNFDFSILANYPLSLICIGWCTIIIEILYPVFIWIEHTRKHWILLTISLHIGIAFVLNLYFFSTIMIIWNLTVLYSFNKNINQ
ncbi:MAG: hypothetical protein V4589_10470 [Bacteroidota bacterium]